MAIDANGNYVSDFSGMNQWGNTSAANQMGSIANNNNSLNLGGSVLGNGSTGQGNSWLSGAFGGTDSSGNQTSGWASPAIGAATGLAQSWLGFQNLGQAKDQLSFQKSAWQEQFNIQKEEYEYQKQRRDDRVANYEASLNRNSASTPSNV